MPNYTLLARFQTSDIELLNSKIETEYTSHLITQA